MELRPPRPDGELQTAPKRHHILYMIDQLCQLGGGERALLNTIRMLPRDRFTCSVVTFKVNEQLDVIHNFPCPLYVMPLRKTYDWNSVRVARKLRGIIRGQHVAITHTFFETSDLWGGLVAKLSGCPILISSRRDMGILRSGKHHVAYRFLRPQYDLVLTVSEAVRAYTISRDHVEPQRVRTIYNGLKLNGRSDSKGKDDIRRGLGIGSNTRLVATVGHIRRVKGLDLMLRAAAVVCREFPATLFLLMGGPVEIDYFRELQGLVSELELGQNVRFLGDVPNVRPILEACDVLCLPSRSEGFSNALIEGMSCALPCVATRVGGNEEAVENGKTGFLVETEDADGLADGIARIFRDPDLGRSMGNAARATAERRFSIEAMMNNLVAIYDEVLKAKNG